MFEKVLVATKIESGKRLLEALPKNEFPVTAAFWIYSEDADDWRLVIISPVVANRGPRYAYTLLAHALYDLANDPDRPLDFPMETISLLSPEAAIYKHLKHLWQEGRAPRGPALEVPGPNVTQDDTYVYFVS